MSGALDPATSRRRRLTLRLKLLGLAVLGLCAVSIPVALAAFLSTSGTSDVLTIGASAPPVAQSQSPAAAVARIRCTPTQGYVALTFDDGPVADTTARLVATLRRTRAVATFFDLGSRAAAYPRLVTLQRTVGQVANHGYAHSHLPQLSHERRLQELRETARILGNPNAFFRPPYGETSPEADADIRLTGLTPVYWTADTRDSHGASADEIVRRALAVEPGGIILMHDGKAATLAALPRIVSGLRRRGLCPGFLDRTSETVLGPGGVPFHVHAVKP